MSAAPANAPGDAQSACGRADGASRRDPPAGEVPATEALPVSLRSLAAALALTLACWGCSALLSSGVPALAAVQEQAAKA